MEQPDPDIDDQATVEQVLRLSDYTLFGPLVAKYERLVVRIIYQFVQDNELALDLSQESFVRAYRRLGSFDSGKGSFKVWLLTIARNLARNAVRDRSIEPHHTRLEFAGELPGPPSPGEIVNRKDTMKMLDRALDELAEPYRSAFILAVIEELPLSEVAAIEDVPVGTVKSRVSRARAILRRYIENIQTIENEK